MAVHSSLRTLNSLHVFSPKPPSFSSPLHFIKLKTLFQSLIFSHIYRIARAAAKAKPIILKLLREIHAEFPNLKKDKTKTTKLFFGSFRMHYNWCCYDGKSSSCDYYDSSWNSVIVLPESGELSGYLEWLEEEKENVEGSNEIDRLADLFITNCHEKFRLEKQESFKEIIDTSV